MEAGHCPETAEPTTVRLGERPNENAKATPIYAFKFTLRWDLGEFLAVLSEVFYKVDNNATRLKDDATTGIASRAFEDPHRFGFAVMFHALLTQVRHVARHYCRKSPRGCGRP